MAKRSRDEDDEEWARFFVNFEDSQEVEVDTSKASEFVGILRCPLVVKERWSTNASTYVPVAELSDSIDFTALDSSKQVTMMMYGDDWTTLKNPSVSVSHALEPMPIFSQTTQGISLEGSVASVVVMSYGDQETVETRHTDNKVIIYHSPAGEKSYYVAQHFPPIAPGSRLSVTQDRLFHINGFTLERLPLPMPESIYVLVRGSEIDGLIAIPAVSYLFENMGRIQRRRIHVPCSETESDSSSGGKPTAESDWDHNKYVSDDDNNMEESFAELPNKYQDEEDNRASLKIIKGNYDSD